jgi:hypothetical protein
MLWFVLSVVAVALGRLTPMFVSAKVIVESLSDTGPAAARLRTAEMISCLRQLLGAMLDYAALLRRVMGAA